MKISWGSLTNKEKEKLVKAYKKTTGPEACEKLGVQYSTARNRLCEIAPKGQGHGGARVRAGMKKGTKLCNQCRKALQNCTCNE